MIKPDFSKPGALKAQFDRYGLFDEAGVFVSRQGHKIRYGISHAAEEVPHKGTKVFTSGYGQHIDNYGKTISYYQYQGYDVYAMDWHNHGLSGRDNPDAPYRPSTKGLYRHVEDLHDFITDIVNHDPQTGPLILSTYSMGGHIGMLYLQEHPEVFDAALMGAPMFDIYRLNTPELARPFFRTMFNTISDVGLGDRFLPRVQSLTMKDIKISVKNALRLSLTDKEKEYLLKQAAIVGAAECERTTADWIRSTYPTTDKLMKPENLEKVKAKILIGTARNDDLVDECAHFKAAAILPNSEHVMLDSDHYIFPAASENLKSANNQWLKSGTAFTDKVVAAYDPATKETFSPYTPSSDDNTDTIPPKGRTRNGASSSSSYAA